MKKKVAHLEEGSIRQTQEKLYIKCVLSTSNNNNNHNNNNKKNPYIIIIKCTNHLLKAQTKGKCSKGASWGRQTSNNTKRNHIRSIY